jgi:hypothetical protein
MNPTLISALKRSKRLYQRISGSTPRDLVQATSVFDHTGQPASDLIKEMLSQPRPCLICRFGFNELQCALTYLHIVQPRSVASKCLDFLRDQKGYFWWDEAVTKPMYELAGFFPPTPDLLNRFAQLFLRDCREIDVLGSWLPSEYEVKQFYPQATTVRLEDLEPYYHQNPWSEVLTGRKVLVIHPFVASIENQYRQREHLFQDKRVLPEFELITLRAVQSLARNPVPFDNWFEAFDSMCEQIGKINFDVAIIGAGAYGFPLAAFVKRSGRQAVHLGGAVQVLFGIKGLRWNSEPGVLKLFNEYWVRPLPEEAPANYKTVENGCYW